MGWWRRKARWRWRSSEPVALWGNQVLRHCQVRWSLQDVWNSEKNFKRDDDGALTFSGLPSAPYVKVYLLENGACIAKKKTKVARKTLDPLYQQQLPFEENPAGKVLQVRLGGSFVWSDLKRLIVSLFLSALLLPAGHCLGRLRTHGPQILHGSSSDTVRRAGPVQHGDWLVQALPSFLAGGPNSGPTDKKSFPILTGQFLSIIAACCGLISVVVAASVADYRSRHPGYNACLMLCFLSLFLGVRKKKKKANKQNKKRDPVVLSKNTVHLVHAAKKRVAST